MVQSKHNIFLLNACPFCGKRFVMDNLTECHGSCLHLMKWHSGNKLSHTLTLKASNKNCIRQHFNFLLLSFDEN